MNIGRETEQIEYKKSTGELNEGIVSIAAILNKHQSGELYFGVKNDGTVLGQEIGEHLSIQIKKCFRDARIVGRRLLAQCRSSIVLRMWVE